VRKEICENVILINAANQHTATNYYSNFMTEKFKRNYYYVLFLKK